MTAIQPTGMHPGQHAGPAAASVAHRHDHEHHDHGAHGRPGHEHPPRVEAEALLPASPAKLALSPLASAGASRVAKTAGAVALLWVAVAWALGWLGQ